ncbi:MAG: pilus assembly protein [Alphaproteobacteria bacterium]|nr:pilus assembly protein [Alphaproteobacteria bacterium]
MNLLKPFLEETRGAVMVEFTIIFMLLFLLTGGIVDFGHLLYQWNSAEKATQAGVRAAVISDPVATELADFDCDNASVTLGTPCRNGGTSFGIVECRGGSCTCAGLPNGCTFSAAALNPILAPMQKMFPRLQAQNVIVEYEDVGLGFAGRAGPVPEVRVRLTGLTFEYAFLGSLLGLSNITMPDFRATLVGEDLSSKGA